MSPAQYCFKGTGSVISNVPSFKDVNTGFNPLKTLSDQVYIKEMIISIVVSLQTDF